MTNLHLHINYATVYGEQVAIEYSILKDRKSKKGELLFTTFDGKNWEGILEIEADSVLDYQYKILSNNGVLFERKIKRRIPIDKGCDNSYTYDFWRPKYANEYVFLSSAFQEVLFKTKKRFKSIDKADIHKNNMLRFILTSPDIPNNKILGIVGSSIELGSWEKPILMQQIGPGRWSGNLKINLAFLEFEYKYVFLNSENKIESWESGPNRTCKHFFKNSIGQSLVRQDEFFMPPTPLYKIAGMAIPVFSLRSERGLGIGEFNDLKLAIEFCHNSGLKMLQILPVNDTIANKTWTDSYPYAAISIFALNPLYINIESCGKFKSKKATQQLSKIKKELNALPEIDIVQVIEHKLSFLKLLYEENFKKLKDDAGFQKFFTKNEEWLVHYACFCYLRDKYKTTDYGSWPQFSKFSQEEINQLANPSSDTYKEIAFYYYLQYHAHLQLVEAKEFGREKQVVLKGDLPIGIYRQSCDAWVSPHLFNMEEQAGAPPDDYAEGGQNWGFPTYNWNQIQKENYRWWKSRMLKLNEYFDALRIDHILGFFRIWQIPIDQVLGTMGLFNPRLPLSLEELNQFGIAGPLARYTQPYIRKFMLPLIFEENAQWIANEFLEEIGPDSLRFKETLNNQANIKTHFDKNVKSKKKHLLKPVLKLVSEILLLEDITEEGTVYNPRITLQKTYSYKALNEWEKRVFDTIYNHYFFVRHNDFWKEQAYEKLPALVEASNMLICGEDLGMIPASVPEVMEKLNIIPLEIQRMPKGPTAFGIPRNYKYYSVCSPSCHDMSTIRGWWEGNPNTAKKFYSTYWNRTEDVPKSCTTDIVKGINLEHLLSPSIIAIFPIQDLFGMDDKLRRKDPFIEQINNPGDSENYWRYRMHLTLEQLVKEGEFQNNIKDMVEETGR
jgi:4-alpha-glucanotransferase